MNLLEPTKYKGIWYLPNSPERKLIGELVYDPYKGSVLEIYDNFENKLLSCLDEDISYDVVLGYIEGNRDITLHNVFFLDCGNVKFDDKETSIPFTKYYVNYFFVDCKVCNSEELRFKRARVHIHNIEEWAGLDGFSLTMSQNETNIHYSSTDPIQFTLPVTEVKAKLYNHLEEYSVSGYIDKFCLSQKTDLIINSAEPKSFKELMVLVFRFVQFVTLALYQSTHIDSYQLEFGNNIVSLYYKQNYIFEGKRLKSCEFFFRFNDISNSFQSVINKWYGLADKMDEIMLLLYDQFKNNRNNLQNSFLNIAQIVESFHALCYDHERLVDEQLKNYMKTVIKNAPEDYKNEIAKRLNSGNGLTLAERLVELVNKCPQTIKEMYFSDEDVFVAQVKDSRNYYTHYSVKGKKHILKGGELRFLSERMRLLLSCCILDYIGFDSNTINAVMTRNTQSFKRLRLS